MKKTLGYTLVVVLVLSLGLYVTLQFFLGGIVKTAVNNFGPKLTQTKVVLDGAQISPLSGIGTLTGLSVGNPAGWSTNDAFRLGKIHLNVEPFSLLKEQIVINELVIEKPEFHYETKIIASNIGDLLKNLEQTMGGSTGPDGAPKGGKPIKIIVKKLVLKDGNVALSAGAQVVMIPLPEIDMIDLGVKEGGLTPPQLAVSIMRHITPGIIAASAKALGTVGGTSGAAAAEGVKQVGEAIKGFFGGEKKK